MAPIGDARSKGPRGFYLVTAVHAAQDTHARTRILYRAADGSSQWIHLGALTAKEGDPWIAHENSDLAIMRVARLEAHARQVDQLASLSIPLDSLLREAPPRTAEIEIVGFPMALGTQPAVAPLVMKGSLASREMPTEAKWGLEPILFAVPVVGAGCSGGPVFQSRSRNLSRCPSCGAAAPGSADSVTGSQSATAEDDLQVVGMYVGLQFDATGVKLAKIVPARVIRAALCRAAAKPSARADSSK